MSPTGRGDYTAAQHRESRWRGRAEGQFGTLVPVCSAPERGGQPVDLSMTTTALALDGYRVAKNLGVVRGITVRSRSIFGTIGATLETLIGGNITLFTELCEKTRAEAFAMMVTHAEEAGANAVIGIRYDATEVMGGVNEVLCYGTAVVVEQITA